MSGTTFTTTDAAVMQRTDNLFALLKTIGAAYPKRETDLDNASRRQLGRLLRQAGDVAVNLDLAAYNDDLDTLLMAAIKGNHPEMVKTLVEGGADINARKPIGLSGVTPLVTAMNHKRPQIALYLIEAGANLHMRYQFHTTAVHSCVDMDDTGVMDALIAAGADIHAAGDGGSAPIYSAVYGRREQLLKKLIAAGADVETIYEGSSLLLIAIANRLKNATEILLAAGASVHATNDMGHDGITLGASHSSPAASAFRQHLKEWDMRLLNFQNKAYTPTSHADWLALASVVKLADTRHPSSVAARLQMLHEMRPDIGLGGMRAKAASVHRQAEGI